MIEGTLLETIFFAPDSSNLDAYYIPYLDNVGKQLQNAPDMKIAVRGFTFHAGMPARRDRLSRERAEQVAQYLRKTFSISEDRITVEWFGADKVPIPPVVRTTERTQGAAQIYVSQ